MNAVQLMGRLTKDPEVRTGQNGKKVGRYTLAVDRIGKDAGADFVPCVCFDRSAEFAEKYFQKGLRVAVTGRIQTGSYTNREGNKIYTTDVIVATQEFADARAEKAAPAPAPSVDDGFLTDPLDDPGLPFN